MKRLLIPLLTTLTLAFSITSCKTACCASCAKGEKTEKTKP